MAEEIKVVLSKSSSESRNIYFCYPDKYVKYDVTPQKKILLFYTLNRGESFELPLLEPEIGKQLLLPERVLVVRIKADEIDFNGEETLEIKVTIS